MMHSRLCRLLIVSGCLGWVLCFSQARAEAGALHVGDHRHARVVFIGDSITGQGGGWLGTGFVFKVREAMAAVDAEAQPELAPLGGSGMGVGAWLSLTKDADKQKRELDVKGVEVAAALSEPADVMVVMLGMNDILAPYVNDSDASLDQWQANYRELIGLLSARLKPKVIGLATITPQTEDPQTPKNRVMARMNERIVRVAAELKARVLPTNETYWQVLALGRKTQADFTLAGDRIHPNANGHIAVAMGMLAGLGEDRAAAWLKEERLTKTLAKLTPAPAPIPPPPWLVTHGLILRGWQDKPGAADLAPNAIDREIESGGAFWQTPASEGGVPLKWQPFQSSINLTDGANAGSVDFAGITFGQNFEAGYAARWIHSDTERPLTLELKSSGVGAVIYLTAWLNGKRVYEDLITKEPKRQAIRPVQLRRGWNVLVFKSCHRTWQWQQSVSLLEADGTPAAGLMYRASAPEGP